MKQMLNEKVQPQSLVDAVTERLEAAIISGDLEPGSKLSEQALANSLGVSRGPLREAIRRLEGRRLLERKPNIGVRVVALSLKDFNEIIQVQGVLQGMACGLAAQHMDDKEIAELKSMLARHKKAANSKSGKRADPEDQDVEFHKQIIAGSRNERLKQMLREDLYFLIRFNRQKFSITREREKQVLKEHGEILDAIARRDSSAAEKAMRAHIETGRKLHEAKLIEGGEWGAEKSGQDE